jgi:hypothetical protein
LEEVVRQQQQQCHHHQQQQPSSNRAGQPASWQLSHVDRQPLLEVSLPKQSHTQLTLFAQPELLFCVTPVAVLLPVKVHSTVGSNCQQGPDTPSLRAMWPAHNAPAMLCPALNHFWHCRVLCLVKTLAGTYSKPTCVLRPCPSCADWLCGDSCHGHGCSAVSYSLYRELHSRKDTVWTLLHCQPDVQAHVGPC